LKKLTGEIIGVVLVVVAIVLFVVQHYGVYSFYGDPSNKWYFYGLVGVVGLIGLLVAAWSYMKE
jgi:hypothetical protein